MTSNCPATSGLASAAGHRPAPAARVPQPHRAPSAGCRPGSEADLAQAPARLRGGRRHLRRAHLVDRTGIGVEARGRPGDGGDVGSQHPDRHHPQEWRWRRHPLVLAGPTTSSTSARGASCRDCGRVGRVGSATQRARSGFMLRRASFESESPFRDRIASSASTVSCEDGPPVTAS